jgi:uncharacterized protein YndB with AHSA1/START domain
VSAVCERLDPRTLVAGRTYRAGPERVWKAWTDPAQLVRWFGTPGFTLEGAEIDLRVGGRYAKHFRTDEGERFVVSGEYRAVEPFERLVYTWSTDRSSLTVRDTLVTLSLERLELGTRLRVRHERLEGSAAMDEHERGWTSNLDQLAPFVEGEGAGEAGGTS